MTHNLNWAQKAAAKLLGIRHPTNSGDGFGTRLKRTRIDYRKEVGDFIDSSVVTSPIHWVQREVPAARLTVRQTARDGSTSERADHPALALIQRPNAYYGDLALWAATIFSYLVDGNAYWIKLRDGISRPGELWFAPHWAMEPKGSQDGSVFISHYEYRVGGQGVVEYDPDDVIHFRHGLNPRNPRKGLSPLDGVIREIFMDLESSNFVSALLKNMGVPGLVVSPKSGGVVPSEDVEATKTWLRQAFGGDRRGDPLVMGAPTDVFQFGFNPSQMNMSDARDIAEERVCAALGIPAAIVGFGAGLQSTKVGATMNEMAKLAWRNGVLPVLRVIADELDRSLLPDFGNPTGLNFWHDTSDVAALQEDRAQAATAWNTMVQGGWAEVAEGREGMSLPVRDSDKIYLRPAMALEVPGGAKALSPSRHELQREVQYVEKAMASRQARLAGRAFVMAVQRQEEPLAKAMDKRISAFFRDLGKAARAAALPVLERDYVPTPKSVGMDHEEKSDELLVETILDRLGIGVHQAAFRGVYEAHYVAVGKKIAEAAGLAGIDGSLPDPVARSIAGAGGRRAGLVDLGKQSRAALFDAIAIGRSEGEGAEALAGRIADHIEAGPWTTLEHRALTIARTETKFAQNISTIERAKAANVERFIVFDGRLGPGRSLPDHIARDGSIVTAAEASQMAADEHPNGTLSFAPYFGEDD